MIFFLITLSACDSESRPPAQADSVFEDKNDTDKVFENTDLQSANGLSARLMYDYRGRAAPKSSFNAPDGSSLTLDQFHGRPLLINIWATYCAPCRIEMPTLDNLAALEEGRLSVITISQDLQGGKVVRPYFERFGFQNIQGYTDQANAIWNELGQSGIPLTILYDSDGKEVWRVVGGLEWDDEEVAKLLRQAI